MNSDGTVVIPSDTRSELPNSAIDYLAMIDGREVDKQRRSDITIRCRDTDYIPKVDNAGEVIKIGNGQYQIMHNGLKVKVDGYYGGWVTGIIKAHDGHHEPQEEKVFYELSKLFRPNTAMIELGAYWAYYSVWFRSVVPGAHNICCEPDPENIKIGRENFRVNGFEDNVNFVFSAAGKDDGAIISFDAEHVEDRVEVPIRSVDSLVKEFEIDKLEVLHMDVQGAEYDALKGAEETIKSGKLRFIFISTHHYLISRHADIHKKCLERIKDLGGSIICEHGIDESFSGDGLIVASFDPQDKDLHVEVSLNRMTDNQFRAYTDDLELVFGGYETQLKRLERRNQEIAALDRVNAELSTENLKLKEDLKFVTNLNIKGATKFWLRSAYRSVRFRALKLIWGKAARYHNTEALAGTEAQEIHSAEDANAILGIINDSDKANIILVSRDTPIRRFIFEAARHTLITVRKLVRSHAKSGQ